MKKKQQHRFYRSQESSLSKKARGERYQLLKHHVVVRAGESPSAKLILDAVFSLGLHSVPLILFF